MNQLNTKCKDCVFSQEKTGCTLNRVEKLGVKEVAEDGTNVLNRFCNTYRPQEWLGTLGFDEQLNPESSVLKEIHPRMGFFIRLKTDEPNAIDALDLTLRSTTKLGIPPAYVVVINDKVEYNEEIWGLFITHFGEMNYDTKYHLMQTTTSGDVNSFVDGAFGHAQNGWIMCLSSGMNVPSDTLDKLHQAINVDMKQLILVEPTDGYNYMIFPAYLFKFLNGNKTKVFQDEIVDGRSFLDKVKAADERSQPSNIMKWEEFYAA